MNRKKNLVRAFALFGCFAVTGVVLAGCGKKDEDDSSTAAPNSKTGAKGSTSKLDAKAAADDTK